MTRLEQLVREIIIADGPMRIDRYMDLCLAHPQQGYYMTRDPLGEKGDFVTAPEVSQVFGELIGVWCIAAWTTIGKPASFQLVELGPGRGTLMGDILRTARRAGGGFTVAASVHLVETSPVLKLRQQEILGTDAQWHSSLEAVPDGPAIFVANEFFDALPIRQFEKRQGRWFERVIGLRDEKLELGLAPAGLGPPGNEGDIIESSPARNAIAGAIGQRLKKNYGAALIIDYGHLASAPGDTLQAMRGHAHVPVTCTPGECDLTSHVDFEALGKALRSGGAHVLPPVTQRNFLLAMGLEQRVNNLAQRSDDRTAQTLRRQMARLADEGEMGNLFKVLAATSPGLQTPYPFGHP